MPAQPTGTTASTGVLTVRSGRFLLMVLLVLLPVMAVLGAPEPMHLPAADSVQHEAGEHMHSPLDMPVCHHNGHHGTLNGLISGNRESESPAPADQISAIPSQGPAHERSPDLGSAPESSPHHADSLSTTPVFLLTRRLRL